MEEPTRARSRARTWPDATTLIAMAWVFLTVYGALSASESPWPVSGSGWLGTIVMLIVAWSVMERRRWGRIAMMGIAAATLLTGGWSVWALATRWSGFSGLPLRGLSFQVAIPSTPNDGIACSAALCVLGGLSLVWLMRRSIRMEFDLRKRAATRAYQLGIGLTLVVVWFIGALGAAAHPMSHLIALGPQEAPIAPQLSRPARHAAAVPGRGDRASEHIVVGRAHSVLR